MTSSQPLPTGKSSTDNATVEPNEVTPAIGDVAYRLTHDLSDTQEDIRDALAFAPLALVKSLESGLVYLATRPRRTAAIIGGLLISAGLVGVLLRRRKPMGRLGAS